MVDVDRAAAIEMIRKSGQRGVPVTVIGDEVVVGFDRPRLERILANLPKGGSSAPKRRSLGAKVADAGNYELPGGKRMEGALVGGVHLGSPAEMAGMRAGDVIVAANGSPVRSAEDVSKAVSSMSSDRLNLTVWRDGREYPVEVTFPAVVTSA